MEMIFDLFTEERLQERLLFGRTTFFDVQDLFLEFYFLIFLWKWNTTHTRIIEMIFNYFLKLILNFVNFWLFWKLTMNTYEMTRTYLSFTYTHISLSLASYCLFSLLSQFLISYKLFFKMIKQKWIWCILINLFVVGQILISKRQTKILDHNF